MSLICFQRILFSAAFEKRAAHEAHLRFTNLKINCNSGGFLNLFLMRMTGFEPVCLTTAELKSDPLTNSGTYAR